MPTKEEWERQRQEAQMRAKTLADMQADMIKNSMPMLVIERAVPGRSRLLTWLLIANLAGLLVVIGLLVGRLRQ